ncbi:amidohydrolase [Cetobacterium somerae]|uniref:M20 metallopeptidase family protein n=2 Tax=Fusobacteriaceae TaxID=203492 RepID=UPI001F06B84E|nr:amidohydrolase [Cetobacterium somerae]MCX3068486.1 amidohydrolase [Cetobacterium somerae]UPO97185.1 amidohydrolase [Cetobacterium somerae]
MNFLLNEVTKYRRDLHQIPEVGFKEFKTQKYIMNTLKNMGYSPNTICETGVYVYIPGIKKECIAFRADIDALAIQEENNCTFSSKHSGFMHACGHDGHTAALLAFAKYLTTKAEQNYSILLIFQPAEEGPGGAKFICETGILEKFHVKEIYSFHLFPDLEEGTISTKAGPFFAQATEFDCKVIGKGGHGGMPQKTNDPLIPFTKIIDSYQSIISRNLSPFNAGVITVGKISGGTARNIISNSIDFYGTIRAYSQEDTELIIKRMKEIHNGIEIAFDIKVIDEFRVLYPPVINDNILYNNFLKISQDFNFIQGETLALAEDFAFYQEKVPGIFFLLGTRNKEQNFISPLHSSSFNFDEKVLLEGVKLFAKLLEDRNEI